MHYGKSFISLELFTAFLFAEEGHWQALLNTYTIYMLAKSCDTMQFIA
jgi:hypothetical protein